MPNLGLDQYNTCTVWPSYVLGWSNVSSIHIEKKKKDRKF